MNMRQQHQDPAARPAGDGGEPVPDDLSALHAQGQEFLAAGKKILSAALSGDSKSFLKENRQHGGQ